MIRSARLQPGLLARHSRSLLGLATTMLLLAQAGPAEATPEFGRRWGAQSCNTCHTVVPKLNERGMDFLARGYKPDPRLNLEERPTVPLSVWITQNYDHQVPQDVQNNALGKVELISGGALGDSVSYFAEWRLQSLEPQANGSLKDRSGRFEDLWVAWRPDSEGRWTLQAGQYRPLFQLEPGRKLSISTPLLYDASLEGEKDPDKRVQGLRSFSTGARSPAVTVGYQSIQGPQAMDGLFHTVTVPFPGEISLPLNARARKEASFEFEGQPKGVVLETYYRRGLNSVGAHAFVDGDRLEIVGLGELNVARDLYLTGGLGVDNRKGKATRIRRSLEIEYLPTLASDTFRPGLGFRVEDMSNDGKPTTYIPYFVLSTPNDSAWSGLLQLEYRGQDQNQRLRLDLSILF